jgi:hypothetical protein
VRRGGEGLERSEATKTETIHHRGYGKFVVDGAMIKLKSKMR